MFRLHIGSVRSWGHAGREESGWVCRVDIFWERTDFFIFFSLYALNFLTATMMVITPIVIMIVTITVSITGSSHESVPYEEEERGE